MAAKVWLALGGASVTGVSAVGGYYVFSPRKITIQDVFKGRRFILESDSSQWTEEFKSDSENIRKFIEELKDATEVNGGNRLRGWCKKQMDLDSKKNPKPLELFGKYCLIRDLASQLSRKGKHLLTNGSLASDWNATYGKRKTQTNTRGDVGLEGSEWKESEDLVFIKGWCESKSKEDFLASDNDAKYNRLLKWCTKEGAQTE